MRKTALLVLILTSLLSYAAPKVEVYYFHYSRRCETCVAVEQQSQKFIQELYAKQLKAGSIIFKGVNLDEKENAALAKKCKAEGQALLVMSGGKRVDLTEQGFMYATYKTEKLKEALKNAVDPLL
jgi:hypothetical protein